MATLKYKNGSNWETLSIETKSETIVSTSWPVKSTYIQLQEYSVSNASISAPTSPPSALFGGTWVQLALPNTTGAYVLGGYYDTNSYVANAIRISTVPSAGLQLAIQHAVVWYRTA